MSGTGSVMVRLVVWCAWWFGAPGGLVRLVVWCAWWFGAPGGLVRLVLRVGFALLWHNKVRVAGGRQSPVWPTWAMWWRLSAWPLIPQDSHGIDRRDGAWIR